jgi:hypothetical protein
MMPAISFLALLLLLGASSLTQEGISAFNGGRYSVALAKLTEAVAKDPSDKQATLFLALSRRLWPGSRNWLRLNRWPDSRP